VALAAVAALARPSVSQATSGLHPPSELVRTDVILPNGVTEPMWLRSGDTPRSAAASFLVKVGTKHGDLSEHEPRLIERLVESLNRRNGGVLPRGEAVLEFGAPSDAIDDVSIVAPASEAHAGHRGRATRVRAGPGTRVIIHELSEYRGTSVTDSGGRTWERRCPSAAVGCEYDLKVGGAGWAADVGVGSWRVLEAPGPVDEPIWARRLAEAWPEATDDDLARLVQVEVALPGDRGVAVLTARPGEGARLAVERFVDETVASQRQWDEDWRGVLDHNRLDYVAVLKQAMGQTKETLSQLPPGGDPERGPVPRSRRLSYYCPVCANDPGMPTPSLPEEPYPMSWYQGRALGMAGDPLTQDALTKHMKDPLFLWTGDVPAELGERLTGIEATLNKVYVAPMRYAASASVDVVEADRAAMASLPLSGGDLGLDPTAPVACKARAIGTGNCALVKSMGWGRHWDPVEIVALLDTPFEAKRPSAVWRGLASGAWGNRGAGGCPRQQLYLHWGTAETSDTIDVGLSHASPGKRNLVAGEVVIKRDLPRRAWLQHRYIVSVEGNDVASNLKWALASWSVPVMPRPTVESWLMEGLLEPYVHFIPIRDDTSDLASQVRWCETRPSRCREVAEAGRAWMEMFENEEAERRLEQRVLRDFVRRFRSSFLGRSAFRTGAAAVSPPGLAAWGAAEKRGLARLLSVSRRYVEFGASAATAVTASVQRDLAASGLCGGLHGAQDEVRCEALTIESDSVKGELARGVVRATGSGANHVVETAGIVAGAATCVEVAGWESIQGVDIIVVGPGWPPEACAAAAARALAPGGWLVLVDSPAATEPLSMSTLSMFEPAIEEGSLRTFRRGGRIGALHAVGAEADASSLLLSSDPLKLAYKDATVDVSDGGGSDATADSLRPPVHGRPPSRDRPTKIVFAVPTYLDVMRLPMIRSLMASTEDLNSDPSGHYRADLMTLSGVPDIALARGILVTRFLRETDADLMLFVDDDITFSPETVRRFVHSGHSVSAAVCPKKFIEMDRVRDAVARGAVDGDLGSASATLTHVGLTDDIATTYLRQFGLPDTVAVPVKKESQARARGAWDDAGWMRVSHAGTGFMMVSRQALLDLVAARPDLTIRHSKHGEVHALFQISGMTERGSRDLLSEDYTFCTRLEQAGHSVWVDVTRGLAHTGIIQMDRVVAHEGNDGRMAWLELAAGRVPGVAGTRVDAEADRLRQEALRAEAARVPRKVKNEMIERLRSATNGSDDFSIISDDMLAKLKAEGQWEV